MLTTYTSVLARRVRITADYSTLPYEAGWASEAVIFTQAEGEHPALTVITEVSPDGITWMARGSARLLGPADSIVDSQLTTFGNWIRVTVTGASDGAPARIVIHVSLKG